MIYNVTAILYDGADEPYVMTTEVTGFLFNPSGNVVLNTPNHKTLILTRKIWKSIEFLLKDADHTIPRTKRLDVDATESDTYSDVQVDPLSGLIQGIVGETNLPERLKVFNPDFHYYLEITSVTDPEV